MHSATILTTIAGGVLGGVFFASFIAVTPTMIGVFLITAFGLVVLTACRWRVITLLIAIMIIGALFGMWRFESAVRAFQERDSLITEERGAMFQGVVIDVDRRDTKTIVVLENAEGRVRLTLSSHVLLRRGEAVTVSGVIERPEAFDDFDYPSYLRSQGINAVMVNPTIVERDRSPTIVGRVHAALHEGLMRAVAHPEGAVASAMVLGEKGGLSSQDDELFVATGTRHLVAISGLHMMLIAEALLLLFVALGLWRQYAVVASISVLAFYVVLVGSPASAIRALLFVVALEGARLLGRPGRGLRVIVLAAAGMVLWNPFLLRWDVGFQLSFLAVVGIGLFSSVLERWLSWLPWRLPRSMVAISLAAMVTTTPLVMYTFGRISLAAPLGNAVVLPFVPLLVGGGLIASVVGAVVPSVASVVGMPVWGLFAFVRLLLGVIAAIPGVVVEARMPWFIIPLWEMFVAWWAWSLHRSRMLPRWQYDEFLRRAI